MEPMTRIVSTIFKLLQKIAEAEKEARRNRARCRALARRAEVVAGVLRGSRERARGDVTPTRRKILCSLKEALDDALKLVESCRQGESLLSRLLSSRAKAARFGDVDNRITSCLVDLNAATGVSVETKISQLAARDRDHPRAANKTQKQNNAGNALPPRGAGKNGNNKGGKNKGGQQNGGGKGGKQKRGKKAAPPPPLDHAGAPSYPNGHGYAGYPHHHSVEEDPTPCAVM